MTERKSFGVALALWFFFGGFGAHRVYAKESVVTLLWYWLAVICTLTIIVWVDLFLLKGMVKDANDEYRKSESLYNSPPKVD